MAIVLKECSPFEGEIIKEEKYPSGKPKLIMKGILQRADTLNQNGRIYPSAVLNKEMNNYQKMIRERRALGELDHTDSSVIELKTVSHLITEAWIDNNIVYGKLEILPTQHGDTVRNLVEAGVTIGISSRGIGTVQPNSDGNQIVQDDFQLVCYDVVSTPSTPGAYLMKESRELTLKEMKEIKNYFNQTDRIDRIVNDILRW